MTKVEDYRIEGLQLEVDHDESQTTTLDLQDFQDFIKEHQPDIYKAYTCEDDSCEGGKSYFDVDMMIEYESRHFIKEQIELFLVEQLSK